MKKKIAAVILTLTLCSTCVTPVFASEGADAAAETGSENVITEELNADGPDSSETDIFYTDVSDLDEAEIIDPADLADPAGETEWISEDGSDIENPVTEESFYEEVSSPDTETDISEDSIPEKNIFEDISAFEEVSDLQGPDVDPETAEEFKEDPKDEKDSGDEPEAQSGGIAVNETNFPDSVFRSYVKDNFDTDADGSLSESEIQNITYIGLTGSSAASLQGIEYFTHLTRLYVTENQLRKLDVRGCSSLEYLYCGVGELQELYVSGCSALKELDCSENQLQQLDLGGCSSLKILMCGRNQLQKLDVRNCPSLTDLYCGGNQLRQLDVRGCSELLGLACYPNQFSKLDVSGCDILISCVKRGTIYEDGYFRSYHVDDAEDPHYGGFAAVNSSVVFYQNGKVLKADNAITAKSISRTTASTAQKVSIGATLKAPTTLSYKSDNTLVKVSSRGVVTIPKNFVGSAVITIKGKATPSCYDVTKKIKVTVKPKATSLTKLTNPSASKLTAVWKRNSKVTGYQIQYAADSSFSSAKTVTVKGNTNVKKSITKSIKKGKTYYVRIRTYKTVDGKNYFSAWSDPLKRKVKK
ncbi:MAG: hypothetical protein HUJ73_06035 [Eubacterium sp.]|nr:hypothetical protein [Eubacterium sp.]